MYEQVEKKPEQKSQSVANTVSQMQSSHAPTSRFVDKRPEAIQMRKLRDLAKNSPQNDKLRELHHLAAAHSVAQKKSNETQGIGFVDNRSEGIAQQKMRRMDDDHAAQQFQPIGRKENNTGLPDTSQSGNETLSGYSMDDVKVHYNPAKPAQLQPQAYAQGVEIHYPSIGQEKHLPHDAWHVVQQKQGGVKPTIKMKDKMNINDDTGLEKEADVMGTKALTYHGWDSNALASTVQTKNIVGNQSESIAQRQLQDIGKETQLRSNTFSGGNYAVIQQVQVTQLALDGNSQLPANEQGGIDNFLAANALHLDDYSHGAYDHMVWRYNRVNGKHTTIQKGKPKKSLARQDTLNKYLQSIETIEDEYQNLVDYANKHILRAENEPWSKAINAGVDAYINSNRAEGVNAAAARAWPGRKVMPQKFEDEFIDKVTQKDAEVQKAFQAYVDEGKLLIGTVNKIQNQMCFPTLAQANARLQEVYRRQTTVRREDWLTHLEIAGRTIHGNDTLHYTVFNDAVSKAWNIRVDILSVPDIMTHLFTRNVRTTKQIHATHKVNKIKYHKYYDGSYSDNIERLTDTKTLDDEYVRMYSIMENLVTEAKNAHGRIGNNKNLQTLHSYLDSEFSPAG